MAKEILGRVRRAGQEKSVPISWDHEQSQAESNQAIEGVGRAGAPVRSLDAPGISERSLAQTRELGTSSLRISRPGVCEPPKGQKLLSADVRTFSNILRGQSK